MNEDQERALYLHEERGMKIGDVAREMGRSYDSVRNLIRRGRRWRETPAGIRDAVKASRTSIETAKHGWDITDGEGNVIRRSVFWRNNQPHGDVVEEIKAALEGIRPAPVIRPPEYNDEDLATLYPLADLHVGLLSWATETGEDFSTALACSRLVEWVGKAVAASPPSKTAILLDVGDFFHANDDTATTFYSKHNLDTDTRHYRTIDMGITAFCSAIEHALRKHERVIVVLLPGNHDPYAYMSLLFALRERYRENPRVDVRARPGKWFIWQFGKVMIAAHHGDRITAQRAHNIMADDHSAIWGKTRYRYLWTGHLHQERSKRIGGVMWEQLDAMTERDAHAVGAAYTARAQLSAITYHREFGEIFRTRVPA